MSEAEEWAQLCATVGKREAIRIANWQEFNALPRWHEFDLKTPERMEGWLMRQRIDAMCARISRGHATP